MNNIALDIAIGLMFIYLLYSLLASTIQEFVAMIFADRPRLLERGIEQMMDGRNINYYWWNKFQNLIWLIVAAFRLDFRINPADFFKNKPLPDTVKSLKIKRSKLNSKAKLFASQIINHPLYRRKAENAFLFTKPSYLESSAFADILLDILSNEKCSTTALPILMKDIKTYVDAGKLNVGSRKILNVYIEQANGDVNYFKLLLQNWYSETMDRVSGWYKRHVYVWLFIIGLVLAVGFNVDTIQIVSKLSVNKDMREAVARSATGLFEPDTAAISQNDTVSKTDTIPKTDTIAKTRTTDSAGSLTQKLINYRNAVTDLNLVAGLGWDESKQKWFEQIINHPKKIIGFLLTAFAISLGSTFWFDLLKKVVNMRASGAINKEPGTKPDKKPVLINRKPRSGSYG